MRYILFFFFLIILLLASSSCGSNPYRGRDYIWDMRGGFFNPWGGNFLGHTSPPP